MGHHLRGWLLLGFVTLAGCSSPGESLIGGHHGHGSCPDLTCAPRGNRVDTKLGFGSANASLLVEPIDGVTPVVKAIDAAQNTIFVSAYILSQRRIVRALERAAAQGVDVHVLLDQHPYGIVQQPEVMFSLLQAAGVSVKWAPAYFQFSHAKFMVLDDSELILSSANFTQAGFSQDRDFVLFDWDSQDVREADNIFRADWDRIAPVLDDHQLLVSPFNARIKFTALIGRAKRTIDVYSEEVLDQGIARALVRAARRRIRVRVQAATVSAWAKRYLTRSGIAVHSGSSANVPYIHAKVVVVDDRIAFVGSENFSGTSLDKNRELGVILRALPLVHRLEKTFRRDWAVRGP